MLGGSLTQNQSLRQEQTLSARQMQSLELLHAPVLELQEHLAQELAANPVLEAAPSGAEITVGDPLSISGEHDDYAREEGDMTSLVQSADSWNDDLPIPGEGGGYDGDDGEKRDYFFNSLAGETTMEEELLDELHMAGADPKREKLAEAIIGSLDGRGYLITPLADIAMAADATLDEAETALALVQSFDPAGIGARSLAECLKLQLGRRGKIDPKLAELIDFHLEDVARNRMPLVAREMRISIAELDALLGEVRKLNPAPGNELGSNGNSFVAPEVTIERDAEGNYHVKPGDRLPKLHIPDRYLRMLEDPALSAEDRGYIREKLASARELIRALDLRESTIRRIAMLIVETQRDFLDNGVEFLKPMTMRQAAERLEVHETTVSRAIAGKYVETPRGIFEFRYFFTTGFTTAEGESVSSRSVRERIRQLVEEEDGAKPLSDDKISKLLADEGLEVARRTVAKYRDELGIPPTSLRRVHC